MPIHDHETRVIRFTFRGYPTDQWVAEIRRTWDDGSGLSGEAWRPFAPHTFKTKAEAEAYVIDNTHRTHRSAIIRS